MNACGFYLRPYGTVVETPRYARRVACDFPKAIRYVTRHSNAVRAQTCIALSLPSRETKIQHASVIMITLGVGRRTGGRIYRVLVQSDHEKYDRNNMIKITAIKNALKHNP